ncbi:hypothetical protein OG896_22170 [Streptomyces sp. NBC_00669]|uniref:hypothetical protein n=1 Tax=Streptomyces sp. NBC_00669 TaxID=2976011 RepID=UPI002E32C1D9|nr:hypothetical protein [Streptomyces sp. NBC_00669]
MTGTPVRNLAAATFALFGEETDPDRVLYRYSVSRSLRDEAPVPVVLNTHPVVFWINDRALQAELDQFADDFDLDDPERETRSRKFGRLISVRQPLPHRCGLPAHRGPLSGWRLPQRLQDVTGARQGQDA